MFTAGGASVVAGGMVAAVTGPTHWSHGSWVAAFLVLVAGVAQLAIGAGQAHLAQGPSSVTFVTAQCLMWNTGCALVIAGTLVSNPATVSAGTAPMVAAIVMAVVASRRGSPGQRSTDLLGLYRLLLVVALASMPIGVALAWARH
ncbi:MAG: hypothetical protein AB7L17_20675 [Ilumatobacteraceae bacterium]